MPPVIFNELNTHNHKKIAIAELNSPQSHNALNMAMIHLLYDQLQQWQNNDDIALVIIQGAGDKAFCAGGDVVSLYHALKPEHDALAQGNCHKAHSFADKTLSDEVILDSLANEFFAKEYQLDQLIHQYTKPILAWGDGYIMGGGVGLFAGASHKVVTQNSVLAMPESTIALYPDVGGSWFLNKMPDNIGLFLGLTGATFNAVDAIDIGLANIAINRELKTDVIKRLTQISWQNDNNNFNLLDQTLLEFTKISAAIFSDITPQIMTEQALLTQLTSQHEGADMIKAILSLKTTNDWLSKAQKKLKQASPLSTMIIYQQLTLSKHFTLAQCFAFELSLSLRCCQFPEFSEGVRALLVDKDKKPQWLYDNIDDIPQALLTWFFTPIKQP